MLENMNDEQKMLIMSMTMQDIQSKLTKHHKILLEGNGELPLVERVRNQEAFTTSLKYWLRFLAGAILLQTLTFGSAAVIYFVKLYPILENLSTK